MKRIFALLVALCLCAHATASAQHGWLPRRVNMGPHITGENRAIATARLEAIERLFRQVPALAHPDSFEIEPAFIGTQRRLGQGQSVQPGYVVKYMLLLEFLWPSKAKAPDHKPASTIAVMVNAEESQFDPFMDAQGREIFFEDHRVTRVPFATETYGTSSTGTVATGLSPKERSFLDVWLTAGGELPWRQVSREDYYNGQIFHAEGKNGEKLSGYKKFTEKTPYQHWLEEAPQRRKEFDEAMKAAAQFQPASEIARMRKEWEETERSAGEQLRKSEKSDRENTQNPYEFGDTVRAQLRRMAPAQRKLPAIWSLDSTDVKMGDLFMRDRDTVSYRVTRILTPNYDFWRARKSPVEARDIVVHFSAELGTSDPPPVVGAALWQVYKQLDWHGLALLLDPPARQ